MVLEGTIRNGTIMLDQPPPLPEGARVEVVVKPATEAASPLGEMLNRITSWPPQLRVALAQRVLESVEGSQDSASAPRPSELPERERVAELLQGLPMPTISTPPQTLPLNQVIGILRPDGPVPDDEECERILDAERLRKYG